MSYSVNCECGTAIPVTAAQAGATIGCRCGRAVAVPLLSRLRESGGHAAYESGVIDTINRMIRDGELPWGNTCAISQVPTSDSCVLFVQCENKWIKKPGKGRFLVVFFSVLLLPFWWLWLLLGRDYLAESPQELGHDRGVNAPVRICKEFHSQVEQMRSQRKLRSLLRTVPIYAQLLDEYPQAKISICAASNQFTHQ